MVVGLVGMEMVEVILGGGEGSTGTVTLMKLSECRNCDGEHSREQPEVVGHDAEAIHLDNDLDQQNDDTENSTVDDADTSTTVVTDGDMSINISDDVSVVGTLATLHDCSTTNMEVILHHALPDNHEAGASQGEPATDVSDSDLGGNHNTEPAVGDLVDNNVGPPHNGVTDISQLHSDDGMSITALGRNMPEQRVIDVRSIDIVTENTQNAPVLHHLDGMQSDAASVLNDLIVVGAVQVSALDHVGGNDATSIGQDGDTTNSQNTADGSQITMAHKNALDEVGAITAPIEVTSVGEELGENSSLLPVADVVHDIELHDNGIGTTFLHSSALRAAIKDNSDQSADIGSHVRDGDHSALIVIDRRNVLEP